MRVTTGGGSEALMGGAEGCSMFYLEARCVSLARAMGASGERVSDAAKLEPVLRAALASRRCTVIHIDVDAGAHLFAPGLAHFKDMHQEPAGE